MDPRVKPRPPGRCATPLQYHPALPAGHNAQESDLDIQRGLLVGLSFENVDVTMYVFNPDQDEPIVVFSIGVSF